MLIQTLIPLDERPQKERPGPPERRQCALILDPRVGRCWPQRATQREPNTPDAIPETDMPAEEVDGGDIPFRLRLQGEKQPAEDKARTTDYLRDPVDAVGDCLAHVVSDAGKAGEPGYPEDGGPDELHERSPEADLVKIMGAEFGQGGKPFERWLSTSRRVSGAFFF